MAKDTKKSHKSFVIFVDVNLKAVFWDVSYRKLGGTDESAGLK